MCRKCTTGRREASTEDDKKKHRDKALQHVPYHMIVARIRQLVHRKCGVCSKVDLVQRRNVPNTTKPEVLDAAAPQSLHIVGRKLPGSQSQEDLARFHFPGSAALLRAVR